jgi:hypothetical protein
MIEIEYTASPKVLRGLDQIAAYLQVSVRTVRRWIQGSALPAIRGPSDAYVTTTSLIDLWILAINAIEQRVAKDVEAAPNENTP